jgi:transcription-repair coupling factor (superfamily II helicase)
VNLRWIARQIGLNKVKLKAGNMRCYFASSQQQKISMGLLTHLLAYIQQHSQRCQLKEIKDQIILIIHQINSIEEAQVMLSELVPK